MSCGTEVEPRASKAGIGEILAGTVEVVQYEQRLANWPRAWRPTFPWLPELGAAQLRYRAARSRGSNSSTNLGCNVRSK